MKLRTRPRSSWSICGSVVEHWSSEIRRSEVQFQFNSSWGLRIFSLCHARDKTKLVGTLYQSNVFEVFSPSPTFKCCWLPTFLCHLAEPTHCYSCQMTKSRLHLRFRPLSARRWFAPRNSSRSAFFSAILYDLRSLSKTI